MAESPPPGKIFLDWIYPFQTILSNFGFSWQKTSPPPHPKVTTQRNVFVLGVLRETKDRLLGIVTISLNYLVFENTFKPTLLYSITVNLNKILLKIAFRMHLLTFPLVFVMCFKYTIYCTITYQWQIQGHHQHMPPMGPDSFILTYKFFET